MKRLTGLVAATFTPLTIGGEVDYDRIPGLVEHLISSGVDGFYVLGSTGEGVSMAMGERRRAAELFIQAVGGRKPVIVQVGHNSLKESRTLAEHAEASGADAISSTPPSYFKPGTMASLTKCVAEVASGAKSLPFYYYHIPTVTGVTIDMPDFLHRAGDEIPNLAGVKFTSPAIWEYQACVELDGGRFDCLYGHDEMLLPAMAVGAKGAVGSTYNYGAPLYQRIIRAFEQGGLAAAREHQSRANAMIRIVLRHGGLPAMKALMKECGYDCGPVRAPLVTLSGRDLEELQQDLMAVDFFSQILPATPR